MPNKTRSKDKPTGDDADRDLAQRARNAAGALGHDEGAELLRQTLDEEKAADEKLSELAADGINQSAADASQPEDESDDEDAEEDDSEEEDDDEDEDEDEDDSEEEKEEEEHGRAGAAPKRPPARSPSGSSSVAALQGYAMVLIQVLLPTSVLKVAGTPDVRILFAGGSGIAATATPSTTR